MKEADILKLGYADPVFFCRHFLDDWFPRKMPWVHRGIIAILLRRTDFLTNFGPEKWRDEEAEWTLEELEYLVENFFWLDDNGDKHYLFELEQGEAGPTVHLTCGRFTEIMMPRGFSKTTVINACCIFKIVYRDRKFILYISETATHAETQLGNIKRQIESSERLRAIFGNLVPSRQDSKKWTQDEIETTTEVVVKARGRGGQVRGLNHNGNRPDEVVVDDLEDMESVSTDVQRDKTLSWFMADLRPVLPRQNLSANMTVLGTLLHQDALMMKLGRDPEWTFIRFGAKDSFGNMLWPAHMDEDGLERERRSYARQAKLSKFYMEFMSELRADEGAKFRSAYFIDIVHPVARDDLVGCSIMIDPAISKRVTACPTAITVQGMTARGKIQLLDAYVRVGMNPREQIDKYFELVRLWKPNKYGVETIAYQAALEHFMREEMFRQKLYFEIDCVAGHDRKKTERIEGILQPRFAARYINFQQAFPELESQLLDWPNGGFDFADCFAMGIALLDPYAASAADPDKDLADDEYEPINYAALGGAP